MCEGTPFFTTDAVNSDTMPKSEENRENLKNILSEIFDQSSPKKVHVKYKKFPLCNKMPQVSK